MFEYLLRLLEDSEPAINSIVGLVTLCAATWGVIRLSTQSRNRAPQTGRKSSVRSGRQGSGWQSIFSLGVSEHSRLEELVAVRAVNVVLFCLIVISLPWLLANIVLPQSATLAIVNLCVFSGALVGFAFQRAGAVTTARWLVIVLVILYWLSMTRTVGTGQGTEYFLAALMTLPVLIISRAQVIQRCLSIVVIVAAFVLGISAFENTPAPGVISPGALRYGYYVNAVFLAAIIFASVTYYKAFAATSYELLSARKQKNDALVSRFIPSELARKIAEKETSTAQWHPEGTVLVATLTGFSDLYARLPAIDIVARLDELYSRFDALMSENRANKIKTLGTAYVGAAGLGDDGGHASLARASLEMRDLVVEFARASELPIGFRCAIATGLTISGVIGKSRPRFDIWGEALDTAAALERVADDGEIVIDDVAFWRLNGSFELTRKAGSGSCYTLIGELPCDDLTP